jgi:hypothetical protein
VSTTDAAALHSALRLAARGSTRGVPWCFGDTANNVVARMARLFLRWSCLPSAFYLPASRKLCGRQVAYAGPLLRVPQGKMRLPSRSAQQMGSAYHRLSARVIVLSLFAAL